MVWIAEVVVISNISGYLECASTTTRSDFPRKGPAKSIWMCCQGFVGHVHGYKGAGGGAFSSCGFDIMYKVLNVPIHTRPPHVASG